MAKNTILIIETENFHVVGAKCKKVVDISLEDEAGLWLLNKTKGKQPRKYYENAMIKIKVIISIRDIYMLCR